MYCFRSIALSVWSKSPCWHCSHHTRCSLVIFLALSYGRWWRTKLRHAAGLLSVALLPVGDLLLRAKHLFVAAAGCAQHPPRRWESRCRACACSCCGCCRRAPRVTGTAWRRRTNAWREATSPARAEKLEVSISPPFGGASRAKSRPVFVPRPACRFRGVTGYHLRIHSEISQAETAGSRAETLDRDREGGRSAIAAEARRSDIAAEARRSAIALRSALREHQGPPAKGASTPHGSTFRSIRRSEAPGGPRSKWQAAILESRGKSSRGRVLAASPHKRHRRG